MKIEFNKKNFLVAVSKASNFTEKGKTSVTVEFKGNEAVIKGADSQLNQIYVANYDLSGEDAICKIDGEGTLLFTGKVESIVKSLPKDEVTLLVEGESITIKQGKTKATVTVPADNNEISIPTGEKQEPLILPKKVLSILADATLFATATKDSRPVLKGVHINTTEEGFVVVGTDSHRLGQFLLPQQIKFPKVTIPAASLKELLNLFDDDTKIQLTPIGTNYMTFEADKQLIYVRLLEGNYPDTSKLINQEELKNAKKYKVKTNDVLNALKLISTISTDNKENVFKIKSIETGLEFLVNSENGKMNVEVAAEISEPFNNEVTVNLRYFKEAVMSHNKEEITIHLVANMRPLFVMSDNTMITQMVLPVRTA